MVKYNPQEKRDIYHSEHSFTQITVHLESENLLRIHLRANSSFEPKPIRKASMARLCREKKKNLLKDGKITLQEKTS